MITTVEELINELSKYPKDTKVISNAIRENFCGELIIFHEDTPEEKEMREKAQEKWNWDYQERMDRRGEITSFANRW